MLWPALVPYDAATKQRFARSLNPDGWAEIVLIPEYLTPLVHLAGFGDSVELAWQTESHLPQLPQK